MDSYACAIVQCAYITFEYFTAHFVAILEIAVLLERIKIMNSFVKKRFTITSKKMILLTFLPCLLFNSIFGLSYAPYFGGEFYYFDSNGTERVNSFWYLDSSTLAASEIGSIFMIAFAFIRDVLTLITTIILNIVSLFELKNYLKIRSLLIGRQNAIGPSPFEVTTNSNSTRISNAQNQAQKSKMKNNIKLIVIMCLISIVERLTIVTDSVYFLFYFDYTSVLLATLVDLVFVVGPTISFFIFLYFNRDFKVEFYNVVKRFFSKIKLIPSATESLNEN